MTLKKEFESYHKRQIIVNEKMQRQLIYNKKQSKYAPKIKKRTLIFTLYER